MSINSGFLTLYKEVPGRPGYRVGSDGTVWSRHLVGFNGTVSQNQWGPWHKLKAGLNVNGYCRVNLSDESGARRLFYVHRLVLEVFVGPCPEGKESRHIDGNCRNNHLDNLEWGTRGDNVADKVKHRNQRTGSNSRALTREDVANIRREYRAGGVSQRAIAERYRVTQSAISRVVTMASWAEK